MRLIDADNPILRARLYTYTRFSGIYEAPDEHADQELDFVPTVEERKKGKWIKDKKSLWSLGNCSVCGVLSVEADTANFCPKCGAEMERSEDDNS